MELEFKLSKKVLVQEDLQEFEMELGGYKVPDDFKKFYLNHNGGAPNKGFIEDHKIVHFNSIKYGESYTIEATMKLMGDILPGGFVPFAYDGGGNPFCINLEAGQKYGHIYFCRFDGPDPELIAESFTDLLNSLEVEYL